ALLIHLLRLACDDGADQQVDGESVRRAVLLVDYFKAHARRVRGLLMADREVEAALRVLAWVAREGRAEVKRWEAHNDLRNREWFPRIEDLDLPLGRLCKHHYLRLRLPEKNTSSRGRPPDPVYEVNPSWDRQVNQANQINPDPGEAGGGAGTDL